MTEPTSLGRVHIVGIGGAGMSGIARIMVAQGVTVSGSDAKDSRRLQALRAVGVDARVGHDAALVADIDTLVVSTAIPEANVERTAARDRGIRELSRAEALAAVMAGSRRGRRGGHARQDHHDIDADGGPAALRGGSVVRHRQ